MSERPIFLKLTPSELRELNQFMYDCSLQGKFQARLRASAVFLANAGMTVTEIAHEVKAKPQSVYKWLRRYREKGIAGLLSAFHYIKLTPEQIKQVIDISHWSAIGDKRKIREYKSRWSFRKIAHWINDTWGIKISHEGVRQMIHKYFKISRLKRRGQNPRRPIIP